MFYNGDPAIERYQKEFEMEQQPLVSINCITYNHEEYIRKTLESFLMQKVNFPFEILVHDDASTDKTAEIIREFAEKYPDIIKPMYQTENQYSKGISNISGAFNFPRARGKYICMCEGDDYWTDPLKMQMQVDYMESHPDCTLCFHSAKTEVVDGSMTEGRVRPYTEDRIVTPEEIIDKTSGYATASLMFPAKYVKELPRYYTDCQVGDIPLQLMMAEHGYGYYMDRDMCVYRVGVSQSWTTSGKKGNYREKQRKYYENMKWMYEEFDRVTGGRFHKEAVSAAERIYFLTMVNTRQYDQVLRPEFKRYYKELSDRTRFFIQMEVKVPWLYRLLQKAAYAVRR